jgi:membrane glycosyltransferase
MRFNPSFNALATAMATARHRHGHILDIARERHVEQALNETPDKLNRDRRLVLLSDPVTMSRCTIACGLRRRNTLRG